MNITVIGRGNVGGGLARRWQGAGHEVQELGRDGGDASGADVVVLAVPSNTIESALRGVSGVEGKPVIDATNAYGGRNERYPSLAHEVKAITGGPVAKGFNVNYAAIYDEIDAQKVRPSNLVCGDPEALELAERLSRDAGYDPASAGGLENARLLENHLTLVMAVREALGGPFFYRMAPPGQL